VHQYLYNLLSIIVAGAGIVVVCLYTWETTRLRDQSERQTALLQQQLSASVQPFVMCTVNKIKPGFHCTGQVWNPTDRFAHDLRVLVCDQTGYFWTENSLVLKEAGERIEWVASGPVPGEEPLKFAGYAYGETRLQSQLKFLGQYKDKRHIAVFFRDVNGSVYVYFSLVVAHNNEFKLTDPHKY
jgi:hypothetical protein